MSTDILAVCGDGADGEAWVPSVGVAKRVPIIGWR
jgi:hypothetical protein